MVTLRLALLPLVVHGVRQAHAGARARPHLQELSTRLGPRPDRDRLRQHLEERRTVSAEHGVSRLGCLPMLLQLPVWLALYHLISDVASGTAVGAMGPGLVSSLGAASVLGVTLAGSGYLGGGPAHLAVVAGLAVTAASLSYVTQRYVVASNTVTEGLPEAMATAQQVMPALSAVGLYRGRRRPGGPARLLGVQLGVDAGPVRGHRPLVPDPRDGGVRPTRGLRRRSARPGA